MSMYLGSVERGEQNPTIEFLMKLATGLKVELTVLFSYSWQKMSESELKRKLHAMVDRSDLEQLREVLALMKAREL
jgi:transcriptional regulator with XRE-family HTH domain